MENRELFVICCAFNFIFTKKNLQFSTYFIQFKRALKTFIILFFRFNFTDRFDLLQILIPERNCTKKKNVVLIYLSYLIITIIIKRIVDKFMSSS